MCLEAIDNLSVAWQEVKTTNMNRVWRKIWPECIGDFHGLEQPINEVHEQIVGLAHHTGLIEGEAEDVVELLESHGEELSNDDLMQMEQQRAAEQEDNEMMMHYLHDPYQQKFVWAFEHLDKAMVIFTEKDPQRERSSQANRIITSGYNCYRPIG